jgi:hypothetical protein
MDCSGATCACHGSAYLSGGNTCVQGNCRVDSDCGSGGYCSPSFNTMSCGGLAGYYCHTPLDKCIDDSDCSSNGLTVCAYSATASQWQCTMRLFCP